MRSTHQIAFDTNALATFQYLANAHTLRTLGLPFFTCDLHVENIKSQ